MSLDYFYDSKEQVIKAEMVGQFDMQRYTEIMREIVNGKSFSPKIPTVWDMRKFDFNYFDVSMAEALTKARSAFPERQGAIISYVVSDPLGYGMMRMFIVLTDTVETSDVFYDYQQALNWTMAANQQQHGINT